MNAALMFDELRRSWRAVLRRPGFFALATATLSLGIAAAVTVFALVDAVLLAPPPFAQSDRLVVVSKDAGPWSTVSPQQYQMLADTPGIASMGAHFVPKDVNVSGGGDPELVTAWPTDAGLLPTLGVVPVLGRNFSVEEDRSGGPRAAIIGHAFWQRHFNADPGVIGRDVLVDGVATPIVGVLPATFRLDGSPDLLMPLALAAASRDSSTNLVAIARLEAGVGIDAATATIDARLRAHAGELGFADGKFRMQFSASPLAENLGAAARPVLLLLLGCAGCVLLLVAVNLSNLMLLRALARGHQRAVRAALGASAARLVAPALGEGLLLALVGAAAGLAIAAVALHVGRHWLPAGWIAESASLLGPRAFGVAAISALLVAVLATVLGMWRGGGSPRDLVTGARMGQGVASQRVGRSLVVAQAALATLLLAASAMLGHSLWKLSRVELGFDARNVLVFRLNPASALYADDAAVRAFADRVVERLRAEPGVADVALTTNLPIGSQLNIPIRLPDGSSPPEPPQYRAVSGAAFAAFAMALVDGRDFAEADRAGSEPVAIVNAAFQRQYLGGRAIGQSITVDAGESLPMSPMRVVGVVADVRQFGPQEDAPPIVYVPLAQVPGPLLDLLRQFVPLHVAVRASGSAAALAERVRAALREVDARQGIAGMRLFERDVADATATQRMNTALVGVFAAFAIVLAAVGLYSVTAVAVASRRREYGVRAALGASARTLMRVVVGRGLRDVSVGLGIGLVLAMAGGRLLERFLHGVGAADPLAWGLTLTVLFMAALVATALPARRAARVQPLEALRDE